LVTVLIYLGFNSFGLQLCKEAAPLALRPTFGPLVEFWVRLLLHKAQAYVIIAFGVTRGTSTKTPFTTSLYEVELLYNSFCKFIGYLKPTFNEKWILYYLENQAFLVKEDRLSLCWHLGHWAGPNRRPCG
jgi:hypothetical protein